jgi:uncharacterized protein involved in exopolysaccharide biosynthesis
MNLESLRKRSLRILTAPPEVLFAMTRHWTLIAICLSVAALITWGKAITEPVIYEGRAVLLVNPSKNYVMQETVRGTVRPRDDNTVFLTTQAGILWSESVLRGLVKKMGAGTILQQGHEVDESQLSAAHRFAIAFQSSISGFLRMLRPRVAGDVQDDGVEKLEQQAITGFRTRAIVTPETRSNTLDLRIYGYSRGQIESELKEWIASYQARVSDMEEEIIDTFIAGRRKHWAQIEEAHLKALNDFKIQNPEATLAYSTALANDLAELREHRGYLRRQRDFGGTLLPLPEPSIAARDPELADVLRQRALIEAEIRTRLGGGEGENSTMVQRLRGRLREVNAKLAVLGYVDFKSTAPEDREAQIEKLFQDIEAQIAALMQEQATLDAKLLELTELETRWRSARDTREGYEQRGKEIDDQIQQLFAVQITVADKPWVSTQPYNADRYMRVLIGSVVGLFAGIVLALVLEILCGKVRCRNDIVSEFSVPLVGVVPRR